MNSRVAKVLSSLVSPAGLLILVVILGIGFVAIVLVPGLELANEVADSSTSLKLLSEQRSQPTLIRAALESMHERLGARGYIQESLDEVRASTSKLEAALHEMTAAAAPGWFSMTGDAYSVSADTSTPSSKGATSTTGSIAGKRNGGFESGACVPRCSVSRQ
jgi:hypothetical protein